MKGTENFAVMYSEKYVSFPLLSSIVKFTLDICFQVPCVAVVENMCHFDADGKRYYPFGRGSGSQACT